jgi:hypothetical protein
MNHKVKQTLRAITGMILLPIFIAVFMMDRFIIIFMFWIESKRLKIWLDDTQLFMYSLLRVITVFTLYSIYELMKMWLF